MSLIRNGGFERGNIDFWSVETDGTLIIDDVNPKYGTYCGKFTAAIAGTEFILNNDYISVNPFDLIGLFSWIKSAAVEPVYLCLYGYDVDYSYISYYLGMNRVMTGNYLNINTQIMIPEGVAYVRAGYGISTDIGEVYYFDGYSADIIKADRIISGNIKVAYLSSITASGDTTTDKKDMQMYKTFEADLIVTHASGTDPTLDVVVYETDQHGGEQIVGTFTQAIATSRERITLTHCTGRQLYVKYVVGATASPSFNFQVYVAGKR